MSSPASEAVRAEWDAVIIGAGPAGAMAAHELARAGHSVLLIEKSKWPRWKVCGCCLNLNALDALGHGLDAFFHGLLGLDGDLLGLLGGGFGHLGTPEYLWVSGGGRPPPNRGFVSVKYYGNFVALRQ